MYKHASCFSESVFYSRTNCRHPDVPVVLWMSLNILMSSFCCTLAYTCLNKLQCSHTIKFTPHGFLLRNNLFLLLQAQRTRYIPTITNHTKVWWVPNVVLAHKKEGIEVVHLASGHTICKVCKIYPNNLILRYLIGTVFAPLIWFLLDFFCFQLHLTEGGLHADINGDGVLDHVQVCWKHKENCPCPYS
jgi:hypothetical protein